MARNVCWRFTAPASTTGQHVEPVIQRRGQLRRAHRRSPAPPPARSPAAPHRDDDTPAPPRRVRRLRARSRRPPRWARSTNSCTASDAADRRRGRRPPREPPATAPRGSARRRAPDPSRLVASTTTPGHEPIDARRPGRRPGPTGARSCRPPTATASVRKNSTSDSSSVWPARAVTPNTAANASTTPSGSRTAASSISHAPSRNSRQHLRRDLQRQAGLADPTHARQRHHPRLAQRGDRPVDLTLAADERTHLQRQVPRERIHRRQRRELRPPTPGAHTWNTRSARDKITQSVLTQIDEVHALGQHVTREIRRRLRTHHLPAVRDTHQPRRTVQRRTEVVTIAQRRRTRVQTHPHPQRLRQRPGLTVEGPLRGDRGDHPGVRGPERGVEPVTRGLHHIAAVRLDRRRGATRRDEPTRRASRRDAPPTGASNPRYR